MKEDDKDREISQTSEDRSSKQLNDIVEGFQLWRVSFADIGKRINASLLTKGGERITEEYKEASPLNCQLDAQYLVLHDWIDREELSHLTIRKERLSIDRMENTRFDETLSLPNESYPSVEWKGNSRPLKQCSEQRQLNGAQAERNMECMTINISDTMYKILTGKAGRTLRAQCAEVSTAINFSNRCSPDHEIIITGKHENILWAKRKVFDFMKEAKRRLPYTHFISLPLQNEAIQKRLRSFQSSVVELLDQRRDFYRFDESIFMAAEKFHITVGMLKLYVEEDLLLAKETLDEIQKEILQLLAGQSLSIYLHGINIMNEVKTKVRVLYAQVDEVPNRIEDYNITIESTDTQRPPKDGSMHISMNSECTTREVLRFRHIFELIGERFIQRELMDPSFRKYCIHATLINTKYRRRMHSRGSGRRRLSSDSEDSSSGGRILNRDVNSNGGMKGDFFGSVNSKISHRTEKELFEKPMRSQGYTFDASLLLQELAGFDFGGAKLSELHLSTLSRVHPSSGYYYPEYVVNLDNMTMDSTQTTDKNKNLT